MIDFIVHDNEGRILRSGICQKEAIHLQADIGEEVIAGKASDDKHYILDGKVTERPLFDIAVVGLSITNIPDSTEVYVDRSLVGQCFTKTIEIEKESEHDTVVVRLSLFPYIDEVIAL